MRRGQLAGLVPAAELAAARRAGLNGRQDHVIAGALHPARALYTQPGRRVDCGTCEPVWPVKAIICEDGVPPIWRAFTAGNARFLTKRLPTRRRWTPG
jgi:hypothetical protein